jgi:acyl-coenzyme A thioesterase PaaI-like protein
MKFEIHFTRPNGDPDFVIVDGDTIKEIRQQAEAEVEVRNGTDPWSREIEGEHQ